MDAPTLADEIALNAQYLRSSFLRFTQTMYQLRTGKPFLLSNPLSRESHFITIAKALTRVYTGDCKRLIINVAPRSGKSELAIHFIAYALANYPDCNFLYVSYSKTLAKKQTQTVRDIISMPYFKSHFGVEIHPDSTAKDDFKTNHNGSVYAAGSGGTLTGYGAGIKNTKRFGGGILLDDPLKSADASSDTIREGINEWYYNTLQSRLNDINTPIVIICQRLHENDLPAVLMQTGEWELLSLKSLDIHGHALYPEYQPTEVLLKLQEENPYVFASQYQQDPQPAGGGIFKPEWFPLLDAIEVPEMMATFITCDTAETDKSYNDASVFSFWGLYRIKIGNTETEVLGLHWIDCWELRVEPKDLKDAFFDFYAQCMRYPVKPRFAAIEKKSTGVTLLSVLKDVQGLQVIDIERTRASGSKTQRFLEIQPYIASKRVSLPKHGKHTDMCLEHMRKISSNNSHRWDDIADSAADGINLALIDQTLLNIIQPRSQNEDAQKRLAQGMRRINDARTQRLWQK